MTGLPEGAASEVLDLACEIQQIPGTTFYESERGAFTLNAMQSCGMCDVHTDLAGNILGRLPGKTSSRLLVLSAHMDSVFPRDFPLHLDRQPTRITGPGIGDNALGLAALLSFRTCSRPKIYFCQAISGWPEPFARKGWETCAASRPSQISSAAGR